MDMNPRQEKYKSLMFSINFGFQAAEISYILLIWNSHLTYSSKSNSILDRNYKSKNSGTLIFYKIAILPKVCIVNILQNILML